VRRPSAPQALVRRARIVLLAHQRCPNVQIAAELGCSVTTVRTWRHRFARGGMPALSGKPRSGRPEVYGPDVRLAIVARPCSGSVRCGASLRPGRESEKTSGSPKRPKMSWTLSGEHRTS
jgi:hypothetical protein